MEINEEADKYIDRFIESELTLIKINDEKYPKMKLKEALTNQLRERNLTQIIAYSFMGGLYLEKI